MSRRGDNIRKRKDGRWEARYPMNPDCCGPKKYGSVYGKTYREAKEKRDHLLRRRDFQKPGVHECNFADILYAWQEANRVRLREASVSRYQNLIDTHILPTLGSIRMSQFTAAAINSFAADKLKKGRLDGTGGLSAAYVRSMLVVISSAIRFGVSERLCAPLNSPVVKPASEKRDLKILCPRSQKILEQELLRDMSAESILIFITLYTGLRIGEACALQWDDIDMEARVIYVRRTVSRTWSGENGKKCSRLTVGPPKTPSSLRCIPMCSVLHEVLSSYPRRKEKGYVLLGSNGGLVSPRTFEYRYKQILNRCGLQLLNYHALRHTFATRCIERGVDIKTLCEILGHANAATTLNIYVHSSMDLKKKDYREASGQW